MKYLIALLLVIGSVAHAQESCDSKTSAAETKEQLEIKTDVPKYLEGATIIVRLKNGRESVVPAEKFKVVPRKQQFIVTKVQQDTVTTCQLKGEEPKKNRVSILAGKGPQNGLNRSQSGDTMSVENKYGTNVGVQYQRDTGLKVLGLPVNAGVQVQNNDSAMGLIGVDF